MAKITLDNILTGYNLSKVNSNFQAIAEALNTSVLYRVDSPGDDNSLQVDIDANNKRILNLPEPLSENEPLRKADATILETTLQAALDDAVAIADGIETTVEEAVNSAAQASTSAANAEASYVAAAGIVATAEASVFAAADAVLTAAENVVLDLGQIINKGFWTTNTVYPATAIWQSNIDFTWYYALTEYTSGVDEDTDLLSGNVAVFAGLPYSYSYVFVDNTLGDKIVNGAAFDDADAADIALGAIYDGTAAPTVVAAFSKMNNQLGALAKG